MKKFIRECNVIFYIWSNKNLFVRCFTKILGTQVEKIYVIE